MTGDDQLQHALDAATPEAGQAHALVALAQFTRELVKAVQASNRELIAIREAIRRAT